MTTEISALKHRQIYQFGIQSMNVSNVNNNVHVIDLACIIKRSTLLFTGASASAVYHDNRVYACQFSSSVHLLSAFNSSECKVIIVIIPNFSLLRSLTHFIHLATSLCRFVSLGSIYPRETLEPLKRFWWCSLAIAHAAGTPHVASLASFGM